jgi:hypothetical protein
MTNLIFGMAASIFLACGCVPAGTESSSDKWNKHVKHDVGGLPSKSATIIEKEINGHDYLVAADYINNEIYGLTHDEACGCKAEYNVESDF